MKRFLNNIGLSLMEMTIGLGILGAGGVILSGVMKNQSDTKALFNKYEHINYLSNLSGSLLNNTRACNATMGGLDISTLPGAAVSIPSINSGNGTEIITTNTEYGPNGPVATGSSNTVRVELYLDSLEMVGASRNFIGTVRLDYISDKSDYMNAKFRGVNQSRRIKISGSLQATNQIIDNCQAEFQSNLTDARTSFCTELLVNEELINLDLLNLACLSSLESFYNSGSTIDLFPILRRSLSNEVCGEMGGNLNTTTQDCEFYNNKLCTTGVFKGFDTDGTIVCGSGVVTRP